MRLGLTLIYVEDFPAMLAFYRDVLGLATTGVDPGDGYEVGVDWAQFSDGNGGELELFAHSRFGKALDFRLPRANANVITFSVENLAAETARLRAHGVEFFFRGLVRLGRRRALLRPGGEPPPALPGRSLAQRGRHRFRQRFAFGRCDHRLDPELRALLQPPLGLRRLT
jgi:catechol 2,3-dioxygenase-like lactoylglutathione lyase family enzyme